jgi:pimeloyl-ACP methyl ester carboxylesterase
VRGLLLDWFPDAEDVVIDGADHSLAITHTDQVAAALTSFLRRHPMSSSSELSQ